MMLRSRASRRGNFQISVTDLDRMMSFRSEKYRHRRVVSDGCRPSSKIVHNIHLQTFNDDSRAGEHDQNNLDVIENTGMIHSTSLQSLACDLVDTENDDSFQKEVTEKTQMFFVGKQEAEVEVLIDRLVRKEGNKDKALLYIVSELNTESKVQMLVNTLLHRGANPSASDCDLWTALHFAVKKNFKGVCAKLLENDAWPDARDKNGVMPYTLAYMSGNDEIAAILISYMTNSFVRSIHVSDGEKPAEFNFQTLLYRKMQRTVLAVLDCMIDTQSPSGHVKVYYHILEADDDGRVPSDEQFNEKSKSPMQIIAKSGNKTIVYHDVVRMLIRRKWKEYARLRFLANSFFYLVTLFALSYSAIVAVMTSDPMVYDTPLQISRAVFEVWTFGMGVLTLFIELNQLRKLSALAYCPRVICYIFLLLLVGLAHFSMIYTCASAMHKLEYWFDAFNWIDLSSALLVVVVLPLRMTYKQEQWHCFSLAYLLWTIRIFKYAAVFRQTGAYAQILWRILAHDFIQFTALFAVILLAFSGSLLLALKGEDSLDKFEETSSFWRVLFVGVRILIEAESVVEYTELQPMSCILMVIFLFTCCVLLLNILIAQLSDTYQNVQQDAQRGVEANRAWIVARVEMNSMYIGKGHRSKYYKESEEIYDISDVLEKWDSPPLNEMTKYIQDIWESLDSHKLNLLTVQNRLTRQESTLLNIQDQLNQLILLSKQSNSEETTQQEGTED